MAPDGAAGAEEAAIAIPDAILAIRTFPRRFREALDRIPPGRLQTRPDPQTWSALERAAHAGHVLDGVDARLAVPGHRRLAVDGRAGARRADYRHVRGAGRAGRTLAATPRPIRE